MNIAVTKRVCQLVLCLAAGSAVAGSLFDLSERDASSGLKAALEKGALAAVATLGTENGFLHNDAVKIRLPRALEKAQPILRMAGQGHKLDALVESMNRAAEMAVPMAKPLLIDAVRSLSVQDARNILAGGDTSVTDFFRDKTALALNARFQPIVKQVTDRSNLSAQYNSVLGQVSKFGGSKQPASVEDYVTQRAVDGLFTMIAQEEREIRRDPMGSGSRIIGKVFGSLRN